MQSQGEGSSVVATLSACSRRWPSRCSCAAPPRSVLQIAQFAAELERYPQAIAIYEGVARLSVDNNLLKYSAKGYLLHAGAGADSHTCAECGCVMV